jgi:hypothetical protein
MGFKSAIDALAPDLLDTMRRFPLAIALDAVATVLLIASINEWITLGGEPWLRAIAGFGTGAILAVSGELFVESRPTARFAGLALRYAVPLAAIALFQVTDSRWFVPYALPPIAVFWLSVAAFTRIGSGPQRGEAENRFWWLNQRAATTAALAAAAFALIAPGALAIQQSLDILFGLDASGIFFRLLLPIAGAFLIPVYWLSTLPRLAQFEAGQLTEPDFLSRAIGFLGQFVLTPILLAYAAILLAYTAQILLTWDLPEGMLGWMVLGFTMTGAATWLLLHPPFMRTRALVGFFRRWWFWLTIVPLALFAMAVWERIGAYGLTPDRIGLIAGGAWAATLTVVYLIGRGDIRLIPVLAAVALLAISIGPWNFVNGPVWNQAARLDAALTAAGITGPQTRPQLNPVQSTEAVSAVTYLLGDDGRRIELGRVLARHGITYRQLVDGLGEITTALGVASPLSAPLEQLNLNRDSKTPVDVTTTPLLLGQLNAWDSTVTAFADFNVSLNGGALVVRSSAGDIELARVPLEEWAKRQTGSALVDPYVDFIARGLPHRYAFDSVLIQLDQPAAGHQRKVVYASGNLFVAKPTPAANLGK